MKLTSEEFKTLVNDGHWSFEQADEIVEENTRISADEKSLLVVSWGYALITATHSSGAVITYHETFEFTNYEPESFSASAECSECGFSTDVTVLDAYGDELEDYAVFEDTIPAAFSGIVYSRYLEDLEACEDLGGDPEAELFEIAVTSQPDIRFHGVRVAAATHSAGVGIALEAAIYAVVSLGYIAVAATHTQWQGDSNTCKILKCKELCNAVEFFDGDAIRAELSADLGVEAP